MKPNKLNLNLNLNFSVELLPDGHLKLISTMEIQYYLWTVQFMYFPGKPFSLYKGGGWGGNKIFGCKSYLCKRGDIGRPKLGNTHCWHSGCRSSLINMSAHPRNYFLKTSVQWQLKDLVSIPPPVRLDESKLKAYNLK